MNLDSIKEFFRTLSAHNLSTSVAVLIGIVLLFLVFKTGKFLMKVAFFLVAVALFAGAYWWHTHR